MSFLQATIRRSIPAVASLALLLVFALYMVVAVPILEGESATAIPNIDPLGLFKSQSPGQWISLFPEDAWQRDQGTRNIIKADENIVIFQDYQQQADGKLQVSKLCLLLFDKESQTNEGEVDLDGKHFPTVIEAIDGAELSFDNSRPTAMGKYGELQQVRFLGEVQFWKESRDPQKSMFLQTQELLVTGQKATTKNPVRFRFGDTLGQAVGLDLVFDNPDLQKTLRPALTKIEGISLARFGNIQHLEIKVPVNPQDDHSKVDQNPTATGNSNAKPAAPTSREIQLQCSGPAEFLFDQLYANFHSEVQVKDLESGYQLNSHLLQILFTAAKVDKKPSLNSKDSKFLPKGLTAHRIIAQGNALDGTPTIVRQLNEPTSLSAAQLTYDLTSEKFQADSVIPGATDSRFPAFVQLISEGIEVQVPQLNYHLPQDEASRGALGQVWAQGAGKLIQDNEKNQLTVSWQNQMTLLDDRDMEDRKVVSFYGDVQTRDREGLELDAQKVHFWLVENQQPKTDSSSKDRFSPDLMLAQDHVRFQSTEMSGLFDEARIYFPPAQDSTTSPTNQIALPGSDNRVGLQQGRAPSNVNDSTATQTTLSPIVARLGRSLIQLSRPKWDTQVEANSKTPTGPYITAGKLMVTLMHSADADAVAAPSLGKGIPSGKYRPQQIHLQEHVEIIEAHWDEGKVTPETKPQYHIQGQNITGIQQGDSANGKPLFQWEIAGSETHEARVETPTMQLQSQRLFFDQRNNRAWTKQPGSVVFPMQMKSLESGFSGKPEPADDQDTNPGVGSLLWHSEMSFDGRTFSAVGNIRCDIQQNTPKGSKQIQARAYQLELMLDQAVSFDGERITQSPQLEQLTLQAANLQDNEPVRLYQKEFDRNQEPVSQEIIRAPRIVMNRKANELDIAGKGKLWSLRKADSEVSPVQTVENGAEGKGELNYIEVEFEKSLHGDIDQGQFVFTGPVHSLYGTTNNWDMANPQQELKEPVRLDCNQLVLNRWQQGSTKEYEMEMHASGSVHIIGQQFESLAEQLNYNRSQDLLTLQGDTRNAAKFWQMNPETKEVNHMFAQKIWYKPKTRWFNVEGVKEGNLTFLAPQR